MELNIKNEEIFSALFVCISCSKIHKNTWKLFKKNEYDCIVKN